jgi:ketosteroid isomerase-like protein
VLDRHAADIVMFDVPPPDDGVRGLARYRQAWPPFFERITFGLRKEDGGWVVAHEHHSFPIT